MEINATSRSMENDPATSDLVNFLLEEVEAFGLKDSQIYYDFPVLKDLEDVVIISKLLLVSREHGVLVLAPSGLTPHEGNIDAQLTQLDADLDHIFSLLYSRLIRNKNLRRSKTDLAFPTGTVIYSPFVDKIAETTNLEATLALNRRSFKDALARQRVDPIEEVIYHELVATIEGAKGMIRPRIRPVPENHPGTKAELANGVEAEIASFDQRQKLASMSMFDGLQRIRGLAGSGKTVVLAMKAALTHLRYPDAYVLYTFHTRSLYQHIQRLVTRFYRQFDDKDPDWSHLKILHAWGGKNMAGVYYDASIGVGAQPLWYSKAAADSAMSTTPHISPFDYACKTLMETNTIDSAYDYVFIDECQDFPASFVQLCIKLAEEDRVVFAYDDLQTIFQAATPALQEIVGADMNGKALVELTEDIILYKCYRNPREVLVCAHALGFGIYGSKIRQMLENGEQWADVGYRVVKGTFEEKSHTIIERPVENSLTYLSDRQKPSDLVQCVVYPGYKEEAQQVAVSIKNDIQDGLRPDDILVIMADDRYAKTYMKLIEVELLNAGIQTNNIHTDTFGIRDFHQEGAVTISTVHKAKGNEAFMVYVLGVDALFGPEQTVRERNLLFTAMTRTKGWVRVSGVGERAAICKSELDIALSHFPNLDFIYPGPEEIKVLKRDLAASAIRKQQSQRKLDELVEELGAEEVQSYLDKMSEKVSKGNTRRKNSKT